MRLLALPALALFLGTAAQAQTIELYGGTIAGPSQLDYGPLPSNPPTIPWDMDAGLVAGGGWYVGLPGGFEIGVDAMTTSRDYTGQSSTISTQSLMLAGRMQFPNMQMGGVTPYAGLGVGMINVHYSDPTSTFLNGSDLVAGYQAEIGTRFNLTSNMGAFVAMKYQATFDDPVIQTEYVEYQSLSIIGGVRW